MWLFPFKTHYLKTAISREEIRQKMAELVYLSDADYKRTDHHKKYFYGTLSAEDFEFQTIAEENRLVPYCSGTFRGAGDEMYIFLNLKAFRVRRLYVLFLLFLALVLGFAVSEVVSYGTGVLRNPPFFLLLGVIIALSVYLGLRCRNFWRISRNSLDFFRGLLSAEPVNYPEIPIVFRL